MKSTTDDSGNALLYGSKSGSLRLLVRVHSGTSTQAQGRLRAQLRPGRLRFGFSFRVFVVTRSRALVWDATENNTWFLGRPRIVDLWGLGGPGGPKNHSRRWGASPPHLLKWCLGPPGPPRPKQSSISGRLTLEHILGFSVFAMVCLRSRGASGRPPESPGSPTEGFRGGLPGTPGFPRTRVQTFQKSIPFGGPFWSQAMRETTPHLPGAGPY